MLSWLNLSIKIILLFEYINFLKVFSCFIRAIFLPRIPVGSVLKTGQQVAAILKVGDAAILKIRRVAILKGGEARVEGGAVWVGRGATGHTSPILRLNTVSGDGKVPKK